MWTRALLTVALRGPGKGLVLASAGGWIVMAWLITGDRFSHSAVSGHSHSVSAIATSMFDRPNHFMAVWMAMILAMSPPLLLREIGRLWRTSLRRLRHLTIGWFVFGYVCVWLVAGIVLSTVFGWVTVSSWRIGVAAALICHLALLTGAAALPQCLPQAAHVARVRNHRTMGFAAIRNLNRPLLCRGLQSCHAPRSARDGPSPARDGHRSCRKHARAVLAGKTPGLAHPHATQSIDRLAGLSRRAEIQIRSMKPADAKPSIRPSPSMSTRAQPSLIETTNTTRPNGNPPMMSN